MVFVAGLWDGPIQFRYRCNRSRALYRDAPPGGGRQLRLVLETSQAQRSAINSALVFPDSTIRLRLDSVEKASKLPYGGELDSAQSCRLQYRFTAYQRLTMPVLVIAGRQDGVAVSEGLRQLTRLLPNARFQEYEGSGHFVYLDEPERFARDVTGFLSTQRDARPER